MRQWSFTAPQLGVTLPLNIAAAANANLFTLPFMQAAFGVDQRTRTGPNAGMNSCPEFNISVLFTVAAPGAAVLTLKASIYRGGATIVNGGSSVSGALAAGDYEMLLTRNGGESIAATIRLITAGVRANAATGAVISMAGSFIADDFNLNIANTVADLSITNITATVRRDNDFVA